MNNHTFNFGDRVVHTKRPDWGPGTITRVESTTHEGRPAQRLHIRFAGAGLKVINSAIAPLVPAEESDLSTASAPSGANERPVPVISPEAARETMDRSSSNETAKRPTDPKSRQNGTKPAAVPANQSPSRPVAPPPPENGWLSQLEKRDPEQIMLRIPEYAKDPFRSIWDRLEASIDLYRFTNTPRGILDWAVGQSGLEDPLTQFNRQELETLFNRWMRIRDQHLFSVLEEADKKDEDRSRKVLAQAPTTVQQAMRRLYARR